MGKAITSYWVHLVMDDGVKKTAMVEGARDAYHAFLLGDQAAKESGGGWTLSVKKLTRKDLAANL